MSESDGQNNNGCGLVLVFAVLWLAVSAVFVLSVPQERQDARGRRFLCWATDASELLPWKPGMTRGCIAIDHVVSVDVQRAERAKR